MSKCGKCMYQDKRYSTNKGNTYCSKLLRYSTKDVRGSCNNFKQMKYTNADKIREMSNEELADKMDELVKVNDREYEDKLEWKDDEIDDLMDEISNLTNYIQELQNEIDELREGEE